MRIFVACVMVFLASCAAPQLTEEEQYDRDARYAEALDEYYAFVAECNRAGGFVVTRSHDTDKRLAKGRKVALWELLSVSCATKL